MQTTMTDPAPLLVWSKIETQELKHLTLSFDGDVTEWTRIARVRNDGDDGTEFMAAAMPEGSRDRIPADAFAFALDTAPTALAYQLTVQRNQCIDVWVSPGHLNLQLGLMVKQDLGESTDLDLPVAMAARSPRTGGIEARVFRLRVRPRLSGLPKADVRAELNGKLKHPSANRLVLELPTVIPGDGSDRLELVSLVSQFGPEARFFAGWEPAGPAETPHVFRTLFVMVKGDAAEIIAQSLQLASGEHSVYPARHDEKSGFWVFPTADTGISLRDPPAQKLELAVGHLLNGLVKSGGGQRSRPEGLTGRILVWTVLQSASGARQDLGPFEVDYLLTYDLTPSIFLEVAASGMATSSTSIPLFEKKLPSRAAPEISQKMPTEISGSKLPANTMSVPVTCRVRIEGLRNPGTLTVRMAVAETREDLNRVETQHLGAFRIEQPSGSGAGVAEQQTIRLPVPLLLKRPNPDELARVWLRLELRRSDDGSGTEAVDAVDIEYRFKPRRDGGILCLDWGTSSIAAGFARSTDLQNKPLPLGKVLRRLRKGKLFDRFAQEQSGNSLLDDASDELIPSNVGIASDLNFRAEARPLSFLDFARPPTDQDAQARRLKRLKRSYDITLPVVEPEQFAAYRDRVVDSLKMLLSTSKPSFDVKNRIAVRRSNDEVVMTNKVNVHYLVRDCLDELASLYLTESALLLREGDSVDAEFGEDIRKGLLADRLRLVLTHPCGIKRDQVTFYRFVGKEILRRLDRGLLPAWQDIDDDPDLEAEDAVVTVPESLAAAYYVLRNKRDDAAQGDGLARVYAFDLGAGTFDVSVIDCTFKDRDLKAWKIQSHFGLNVGGRELDQGLYGLIDALLRETSRLYPDVSYVHKVVPPGAEQDRGADARLAMHQFAPEFERAKRELSRRLFKDGSAYAWQPGQAMRIKVGVVGAVSPWPVEAEPTGQGDMLGLLGNGSVRVLVEDRLVEDGPNGQGRNERAIVLEIDNIFSAGGPAAFADCPAIVGALEKIDHVLGLIAERLPRACQEYLNSRPELQPDASLGPVRHLCVVTGRAALWPPLYQRFEEFARSISGTMLPGKRPLPPHLMKQAVMYGALQLAHSPEFLDPATSPPDVPLALRLLSQDERDGRQLPGRIVYVEDVASRESALTGASIGPLQIARVVPGMKSLTDPRDHALVRMWEDLPKRAIGPQDLVGSGSQARPSRLWVEIEREVGNPQRVQSVTLRTDISGDEPMPKFRGNDLGSAFLDWQSST